MELIIFYIISSILQLITYIIYTKEMLGYKRNIWWIPLFWIAAEGVQLYASTLFEINGIAWIIFLIFSIFSAIFVCYGSVRKKVLIAALYVSVQSCVEIFFSSFMSQIGIFDADVLVRDEKVRYLALCATQIFTLLVIQLIILLFRKLLDNDASVKAWLGVIGITIVCNVIGSIMVIVTTNSGGYSVESLLIAILLIAINFATYYIYVVMAEKNKMELDKKLYDKQIAMYEEWYNEIQHTRDEMNSFRHDVKNHLGMIQSMCQMNDEKESVRRISEYLTSIGTAYSRVNNMIDTGNTVIDAVIGMKRGYAVSKGIRVEVENYMPGHMLYDDMDVVVILGNLLDNAIEACDRMKDTEDRWIRIMLKYTMGNVYIAIENSFEGKDVVMEQQDGKNLFPKTSKKRKDIHGIGMSNVKRVVDKYNGELQWKGKDGVFLVEVYLYDLLKTNVNK